MYDEDEDDDPQDSDQADSADDQSQDDPQDTEQALADAPPHEVNAHRSMLSEVFQALQGQGVDTTTLAAQAGAGTDDPSEMSHSDLINTTLTLAREHPELVQDISERFPEAQGILSTVLNSGKPQSGGGGLLGSLLGRL